MFQFKKHSAKKNLRRKENLDIDPLEEARAERVVASDLVSHRRGKQQAAEEEERSEGGRQSSTDQVAFAKADETSTVSMERIVRKEVAEGFADDLQITPKRERKLDFKAENEKAVAWPEANACIASSTLSRQLLDAQNSGCGDAVDSAVIFTETEEFVWGLQLDEASQKPKHDDVFLDENQAPEASDQKKEVTNGRAVVLDPGEISSKSVDNEGVALADIFHEALVGRGFSSALKLLRDRSMLKEFKEHSDRDMDTRKRKLAGICREGPKQIHLERRDGNGRILTEKESFRLFSHEFHGKKPGKRKQEKRMKRYQDELKQKQMSSSSALPLSVERMREAQSQLRTPYILI